MRIQNQYIKRAFASFTFILLAYISVFAQLQTNILTSNQQQIEHIGLFVDKDNKLTFEDVQKITQSFDWSGAKGFYREHRAGTSLFKPMNAIWWHLSVKNEMSDIQNWVLRFKQQHKHDVYMIKNGTITYIPAGEFVNKPNRNYLNERGAFQFELLEGEEVTFFVKHTRFDSRSFRLEVKSLELNDSDIIQDKDIMEHTYHLGFIFIAFFLSLFTFLQLLLHRDKAYLYYALYLLITGLYFLQRHEGQEDAHFLFTYIYKWYYVFEPIMTYSLIFFYALFAQSFVAFDSHIRKSITNAVKIAIVIIFFATAFHIFNIIFFDFYTVRGVYIEMRKVCLIAALPIPFYLFRNNKKLSYIFLMGTLFILAGAAYTFWFSYRPNILRVTMLLEFLCFSTALGYKTKLTQDEKKRVELELADTELEMLKSQEEKNNLKLELIKTALEAAESQLKALKAQLHPHFIFNSMNSIKKFIITNDNDKADEYLIEFSELLRQALTYSDKQSITLDEEIEFAELYIKLESLRFKDSFNYEIIIDESIDVESIKIPTLILQPYIENAIEHGLFQKEGKKELKIEIRDKGKHLVCAIDDNGIGREKAAEINTSPANHTSIGNKLNQQRIDLYNTSRKDNISVSIIDKPYGGGTRVEISIPTNYDNL